jgi:hypothetical protein
VRRLRIVTGKDGNPLNEVELLADSLMGIDGDRVQVPPAQR